MILIKDLPDFDLSQTLECGQCFRWDREADGSYTIVAFSRVINLKQEGSDLRIENATQQEVDHIWRCYLDLDRDYGHIKRTLSMRDPVLSEAIRYGQGIRLLKQDEWETLISFIVSQNANIPRIRKCIDSLCRTYGKPLAPFRDKQYYAFPEPVVLSHYGMMESTNKGDGINNCGPIQGGDEKRTRDQCRLGYRARYISETAAQILADEGRLLYKAKDSGATDAERYLLSLSGVGPKVARCTLLFSMGFYDQFPLDVWMKRVMADLYGFNEKDSAGMARFAAENFGDLGGFAQQYLFYYIRNKLGKSRPELAIQ
jgi:N-glycosylase/DNA lyase